jgi:DNA-binding transcriptional MerR regulator
MPVTTGARYGIAELAELGGVSRRTVRYYIQEGLLPAPLGVGRGRHYSAEHLERLIQVKALQERGRTLQQIKQNKREKVAGDVREARAVRETTRSIWSRVELLPGLEIHVSGSYRLPGPGRLRELAEWCRQNFQREGDDR